MSIKFGSNKPCPSCRKRRVVNGKCSFCGWTASEVQKEDLTDAWDNDVCPDCGSEVDWEDESLGAIEGVWYGTCQNPECEHKFEATLVSTLESVTRR